MDVNEIIRQLQQAEGELIGEMPTEDEYVVRRKERTYGERIDALHASQRDRYAEGEGGEAFPENLDIEPFIWIPDEDIPFPEIDSERIAREISKEGVEALAWYRSFHWRPCERWGIYILDEGLYYVAHHVFGEFHQSRWRPFNTLDLLRESFRLLFLHEFFHYITDIAASTLEIASGLQRAYYIEYIKNVYMRPGKSDEPLEEALANAFALNRIHTWQFQRSVRQFIEEIVPFMRFFPYEIAWPEEIELHTSSNLIYLMIEWLEFFRSHIPYFPYEIACEIAWPYEIAWQLQRSVGQFMKNQPSGYSAFDQYIRKSDFARGRRELGTCISRAQRPQRGVTPLETLFDCYRVDVSYADVPVYIVSTITDSKYRLRLIQAIPRDRLVLSPRYVQDYQRLPSRVQQKVSKTLSKLERGVQLPGLGFEKVKGYDCVFAVRVDRDYRLTLQACDNGTYKLLRVGKHDDVYKSPV